MTTESVKLTPFELARDHLFAAEHAIKGWSADMTHKQLADLHDVSRRISLTARRLATLQSVSEDYERS